MSNRVVVLTGRDRPAPGVLALLEALNAFTGPRVLRRWQQEALTTGRLRATFPLDGRVLECDATLWLDHRMFAYRFRHDAMTMWLLTGGITTGWHLCGLALMPMGLGFAIEAANDAPSVQYFLDHLEDLAEPSGPAKLQVVVGHPNFAHHLWSELPALAAVPQAVAVEAVVLWEPILPLDRLVVWRGAIARTTEDAARPAPGQLLAGIRLPLGSTRIPAGLAERICRACAWHDVMPPGRPGAPAVSLGLRSMYRRPVNQLDFARALLARLPAGVDVYLDGFSLPDDIDVPGRHDSAAMRGWQRDTRALAGELMASAPTGGPRLIDATHLSEPQLIALGGRLCAHVAPHGTQQHKFGWLRPLPGVVHSGPYVTQPGQAAWLADQYEAAAAVSYLPVGLVETVPGDGPIKGHPWFDDYRFVDIDQAAAYAARELAPYLRA